MKKHTPAEYLLISLVVIPYKFTFRSFLSKFQPDVRAKWNERYHLIIIVVFIVLSIFIDNIPKTIALIILFYISNEVITSTLFDIFIEAKDYTKHGRRNSFRSFLWTGYCYIAIIWSNAIYYVTSKDVFIEANKSINLGSILDGLFFSFSIITNSNFMTFSIRNNAYLTKFIMASEQLISMLIIVFYLAVYISSISIDFQKSLKNK